jgi:hypothetical protein
MYYTMSRPKPGWATSRIRKVFRNVSGDRVAQPLLTTIIAPRRVCPDSQADHRDPHSLGGFDIVGYAETEDAAGAPIIEAKADVVITDIQLRKERDQVRAPTATEGIRTAAANPSRTTRTTNIAAGASSSAPTISSTSRENTIVFSTPCGTKLDALARDLQRIDGSAIAATPL